MSKLRSQWSTFGAASVGALQSRLRSQVWHHRWPEWFAIGAYATFVASLVVFHEPFADEAQAWQIAAHTPLWHLLAHALRYEGTPGLWFVLLHALHALNVSYAGMHWATALIAIGAAALLIFIAPFSEFFRLLLPFTFFLAYQYAVVARSYVLVPVLVFLIAIIWDNRSPVLLAVLLGLLSNVSAHAFFISVGFAITWGYEIASGKRRNRWRDLLIAAAILLLLDAASVACVWPIPADRIIGQPAAHWTLARLSLAIASGGVIQVLLAISSWPLAAMLFGGAFLWVLCRRETFIYLAPLVALTLFCGYTSELHHAGLAIPTGIAICWILRQRGFKISRGFVAIAGIWVLYQVSWTGLAAVYEYRHPYSPDQKTASYLADYIAGGGRLAAGSLNDSKTDAFWAVGLEPYFQYPILLDQALPFWVPSISYHTEAGFQQAVERRPGVVLLEYHSWLPFDQSADIAGEHVSYLENQGYHYVRTFCGAQIAGWSAKVTECHVVFER